MYILSSRDEKFCDVKEWREKLVSQSELSVQPASKAPLFTHKEKSSKEIAWENEKDRDYLFCTSLKQSKTFSLSKPYGLRQQGFEAAAAT